MEIEFELGFVVGTFHHHVHVELVIRIFPHKATNQLYDSARERLSKREDDTRVAAFVN